MTMTAFHFGFSWVMASPARGENKGLRTIMGGEPHHHSKEQQNRKKERARRRSRPESCAATNIGINNHVESYYSMDQIRYGKIQGAGGLHGGTCLRVSMKI